MLNSSDILRGLTDTLILACLFDKDSYGYEINKTVTASSGGTFNFKEATLYTSFRRLEESGFIKSYWGGEETGARRRYYTITETGKSFFLENKENWNQLKNLVDSILQTNNGEK